MLRLMRRKAQSTAEYAIVIGLVIAAAVGMQIYVKRQLQGKVRDATNYTDPEANNKYGIGGSTPDQYEPYYNTLDDVESTSKQKETVETFGTGGVKRETAQGADLGITRKGTQGVELSPNN